ncbi:MAG TPA: M3 family metallopeptidase [Rhizomicrobium sp.]|nr:M3 family metallopeptidase [Rhizomicrobium sp.]
MKQGCAALALFALLASPARAADKPWRVDLGHYFAGADAEAADRKLLDAKLVQMRQLRAHLGASPAALLSALSLHEAILASYGRHDAYLVLRCRSDRTDGSFCADDDALAAAVDAETAELTNAAAALPPGTLARFLEREPRLRPYRFFLAEAQRKRVHLLPAAQETLLSGLVSDVTGWQDDLYEAALDDADMGSVATPHGTLDVRRQRNLIAVDPDQAVRREGYEKRLAGFVSVRGRAAFALTHLARAGNDLAKAYGFANAPDRAYFAMSLDPSDVRATIARAETLGELQKRFERLRAAEVEHAFALKEAGPWDMSVPLTPIANLSPSDAVAQLRKALSPLGAWYGDAFDALADPANGRLDLVPGGALHRGTGGFSVGFAGAPSALFLGAFDGAYKDMSVMAHEGGHAVHRALMAAHGVRPLYSNGPHFLFESFAEFNELVLADAMSAGASDAATRRYYDERFLAIKGLDFLAGAEDAALEQEVYDGVLAGKIASADDIDALNLSIAQRFSIWPARVPALKASWEGTALAFEDPFYDVNYLYASMLALEYYELYRQRPQWFLPRYRALLEGGFDDTPRNLLKTHLGIALDGTALLDDAARVVDARLRRLEMPLP